MAGWLPLLLLLLLCGTSAALSSNISFSYRDVGFDSGGWVTGLYLHEASGIVYQRTDVGGCYRSDDGGVSWVWLSGRVATPDYLWSTQGLATNQSDPSGLTVLTAVGSGAPSESSGIYKSTDGGATWVRTLAGVAANANSFTRHASPILAIDAARPSRVWAAMQQGLWRSDDGGASWAPVEPFNAQHFYVPNDGCGSHYGCYTMALVSLVPPGPDGTVAPGLAGHVLVGAAIMGLAFSPDDGASWAQLSAADGTLPPGMNITTPWRVHRFPNGTAIMGADVLGGGVLNTDGGVWRVTAPSAAAWADPRQWVWTDITPRPDAATGAWGFWGLVDTPLGFDAGLLVVASSAPSTIFTSTDGGDSWTQRGTNVTRDPPCWQPAAGQSQLLPYGRNNIVVSRRRPGVWLLSTGFGVAESVDQGDSWGWASAGLGEVVTFRCHSHPSTANWTWCGAGDLTGFIITDGGLSSRALAAYSHMPTKWAVDFGHGVAWDAPTTPGSRGLSFPGGYQLGKSLGQWITWPDPLGAAPLAWTAGVNSTGVLSGVPLQWVGVLQVPDDPRDLLLLTANGDYSGTFDYWNESMPLSTYTGGLVRSTDGGSSWAHVAQQPASGFVGDVYYDVAQLSVDGGDAAARWWALSGVGLHLSRDRGETWGASPLPLCAGGGFAASVVADTSATTGGRGAVWLLGAGRDCFGNGTALRHTADYGATWTVVGAFSVQYLSALAAHASGRLAVVGTAPGDAVPHVHVSLDSGASWAPVDLAERGHYLAPGVSGLEWDAIDPTVLYVSCNGHSVVVVKLDG